MPFLQHCSVRPIRVGLLDFGDGRPFLQQPLAPVNQRFTEKLTRRLQGEGFEIVAGDEVIWQNDLAVREGKKLAAADVDVVLFSYSVWAWPQYTRVAAQFCPQPLVLFAHVNPSYPGLVGMLAGAGSLDQSGVRFYKTFGDIDDDSTLKSLTERLRAVAVAHRLRGQTYALIGGRSLGIDTTVIDPAQWMEQFGIDVDHIDQFELIRRSEEERLRGTRIPLALDYLKKHVRQIHWTAADAAMRLTEELLVRQLGLYYAALDLCQEFGYHFCGIKGQRELTEHYATADVAEAFLNDPYGPEGSSKPVVVCSTEADSDAALTMQILHLLADTPALFADVRHYHADLGVWDLCNSGEHATWFAARSSDPAVNLAKVEFRPEGFYFPAGGASVYHIAAPGPATFARLTRHDRRYRLTMFTGAIVDFGDRNEEIACRTQDNWPHAFARFDCNTETFINNFQCNHIHAIYGNWIQQLVGICEVLGIEPIVLR